MWNSIKKYFSKIFRKRFHPFIDAEAEKVLNDDKGSKQLMTKVHKYNEFEVELSDGSKYIVKDAFRTYPNEEIEQKVRDQYYNIHVSDIEIII